MSPEAVTRWRATGEAPRDSAVGVMDRDVEVRSIVLPTARLVASNAQIDVNEVGHCYAASERPR
jgi:hypothetical protein